MPRILICEDFDPHFDTYADRLKEAGVGDLEILRAKNAKIAKDLLSVDHFDLMLLDDRCPVQDDGLNLLEWLRSGNGLNKDIEIIMTSIRGDEEAIRRAREGRVAAYLRKPISRRDFEEEVIRRLRK